MPVCAAETWLADMGEEEELDFLTFSLLRIDPVISAHHYKVGDLITSQACNVSPCMALPRGSALGKLGI